MKNTIFSIALLICFPLLLSAQHLARKANMGIYLEHPSMKVLQTNRLDKPQGMEVTSVAENSFIDAVEIQSGDLLIAINGKRFSTRSEVGDIMQNYNEGQLIQLTYLRDGQVIYKEGIVEGKPKEKREFGHVTYGEVKTPNGYVRTILATPLNKSNAPLVFFIQGYGLGSMDGISKYSPYSKIVDGLLQKGYAVLRMEKLGVGDSEAVIPKTAVDFNQEMASFEAVYNAIPEMKVVDPKQVYIFGHYVGGIIAPMIHAKIPPKGIIVYGTVARPWYEYFIEQGRTQRLIMGEDYVENEKYFPTIQSFYHEFMINKQTPDELHQIPEYDDILRNEWSNDGADDLMNGRNYAYWQQLQEIKPFENWSNVPGKVLSIWGSCDFVAFSKADHELIADIVNHYHPGNGTFLELKNSDHTFTFATDFEDALEHYGEWGYIKDNFNKDIITIIDQWIKK